MTVADVAAGRRNQVPLGIAYMVGSTAMFAGGNAVVKWQLATYPLGEVAFGRTLFAFLTVAAIVLPRAGWSVATMAFGEGGRARDLFRAISPFQLFRGRLQGLSLRPGWQFVSILNPMRVFLSSGEFVSAFFLLSSAVKFAVDSLLEGDGFELPVPRELD
jgi:hypothetical protein